MSSSANERDSSFFSHLTWFFKEYQVSPYNDHSANQRKTGVLLFLVGLVFAASFTYFYEQHQRLDYIAPTFGEEVIENQCLPLSRYSSAAHAPEYGMIEFMGSVQLFAELVNTYDECRTRVLEVLRSSCRYSDSIVDGHFDFPHARCSSLSTLFSLPLRSYSCWGDQIVESDLYNLTLGNASATQAFVRTLAARNASDCSGPYTKLIDLYPNATFIFQYTFSSNIVFNMANASAVLQQIIQTPLNAYGISQSFGTLLATNGSVDSELARTKCPTSRVHFYDRFKDVIPQTIYPYLIQDLNSSLANGELPRRMCKDWSIDAAPFHCVRTERTNSIFTCLALSLSVMSAALPALIRLITLVFNKLSGSTKEERAPLVPAHS